MFLFTTPTAPNAPTPQVPPSNPVVDAIRRGAADSGTSFDYLLATAQRESALDPTAKAPTSSATGLFQFIEQTWLGLVKSEGAKLGLSDYAGAISTRSDGSLGVADPGTRQAILKLREDPQTAATLAGALAQKNRKTLAGEIGREPTGGDLYVAHVLGARGASELIQSAGRNPTRAAALDFPEAAAANRPIFYDRAGRARGSAEVYAVLAAAQSGATGTVGSGTTGRSPASPAATTTGQTIAVARRDGPALYGLFQTDSRTGPISEAVAKIWRTNATGASTKVAALSFFPRDTAAAAETPAAAEPVAAALTGSVTDPSSGLPATVGIPLPPARPSSVSGATAPATPLNLLSYMKWRRT